MKDRPLIPAERQVAHLAERGVRFDIMSPEAAVAFLRDKNFFFKVKAFAKCFSTYQSPASEGYGRLTFAAKKSRFPYAIWENGSVLSDVSCSAPAQALGFFTTDITLLIWDFVMACRDRSTPTASQSASVRSVR